MSLKLRLSKNESEKNVGGDMTKAARSLAILVLILWAFCSMPASSHAAIHTLQVKRDAVVVAEALVDDAANRGMNSLVVDNTQRLFQQWFWYRLGSIGSESSLYTLILKSVSPPTTEAPGALSLTYTLEGQFDITIDYLLTYPAGGSATVNKTVTITNTSSADLSYHLFEYSDFDVSATGNDNVEAVNNRVYQNSTQSDASHVTLVHAASRLPDKFDIDGGRSNILPLLEDSEPSDLSIPQTPYLYDGDLQFAYQWDLAIPAAQTISFAVTDTLYPTVPATVTKTHAGTCVTYQDQADYTITYDNIANSSGLTNVKIIDYLPANTVISATPPSNGGVYDSSTNTVTWSLASLAAGAAQQTEALSITVNSAADITNEALLVSDQAFPTRITDFAALCNHPPTMNAIDNATINEGAAFSTQVVASDPDNETLVYSLSNAPAGMNISSAGLINWPVGVVGTYVITVTATDPGKLSASKTFTLTVNTVNLPPTITSSPITTANDYQEYTYTVMATDPEGDVLTYELITAPLHMTISGNKISWIPTIDQVGSQNVTVLVKDGHDHNVPQSFTITVSHVNRPPVISTATLPPTTATVGVLYSYKVTASDPEYNTPLTYSLPVCPAGMTIGTTGAIAWTPTAAQNNNVHDITAKVTDSLGAFSTLSFSITVGTYEKQTPVITWATPVAINYGTTLSATQLNATASVPGTFTYNPAIGAVLNTGSQTLSVTFTPTDTSRYTSATASVTLTVNPVVATVVLNGLSQTYDGTAKTVIASTTPAGLSTTITYNGSTTAPSAADSYAVVATISDANYSGSATGTLTIAKASPAITWATPASIVYGTALSATQLNASAAIPGSLVYSPVSGSILNAGSQTLSVTFTPTDTASYNSTTVNVPLAVNPATATVGLSGLSQTYDGNAKTVIATTTPAGLNTVITYNGSSVVPTAAGSYAVVATVNDANYTGSASGTLTVNPAVATVVLGSLSQIYDGTVKTVTASTTPAGLSTVITYNGSATAPSAVGSYAVAAIISDGNYSGSASGTLTIAPTVVIGTTSYTSMQAAYSDAADGAVIQSLDGTLTETLTATESIAVKMKGGYNLAYDTAGGFTTIQGQVLLRAGTLRVERIKVK